MSTLKDFKTGDRVKIAPWTDSFMRGLRYGDVTSVGRKWITVEFLVGLRSSYARKIVKFSPDKLEVI